MDQTTAKLVLTGVFVGAGLLELVRGRFGLKETPSTRNLVLDGVSALILPLAIVPTILLLAPMVAESLLPGREGWLAHLPGWAMFGVLLLADDLTQYMWHRLSHTRWLYPLHRAHHSAEYMSISIVYRNNLVYYMLMPGIWLSGMLIHWGFGPVYAVYIILKMTVIIGAHSSIAWDAPLYRHPITSRLMWVVERVISTPATHSAHHGLDATDGVTHYHGNYGNFLFLWDVLFGTAKITRRRPARYGIEGLEPIPLANELLLPVPIRPVDPSVLRTHESRA